MMSALDAAGLAGANRFALTFPCFWCSMLPDLAVRLHTRFKCVLKTDNIIVFDI
jgi:hypothetical protein